MTSRQPATAAKIPRQSQAKAGILLAFDGVLIEVSRMASGWRLLPGITLPRQVLALR